jgi:hypothetical protein
VKSFEAFIREDHEGHVERSGVELANHADRTIDLEDSIRQQYFYGITTVFPLMLLSHYQEWRTGVEPTAYMEQFVPQEEEKLSPITNGILGTIYQAPTSNEAWIAGVSSYLSAVPFEILQDYAAWAKLCPPEQVEAFIQQEQAEILPQLLASLSHCTTNDARVKTVLFLGGDYPFEFLTRAHRALAG